MDTADVLRAHFGAFGSGGLDAVAQFWHPAIEWRAVEGAADDVGVMRGHDALRRYYEDWTEALVDLRAEVDEILFEDGERVVAAVRNSGRGQASGARVEGRYCVACLVSDDLIVAGRGYATAEQAVEGVAELG